MDSVDASVRLNKFIATTTGKSRREADNIIEQGRVTINGAPIMLGARVHASDTVEIDGQPVVRKSNYTYILLNKPTGYVCSRRKQGETPTVYSLLPQDMQDLKLVGRLDKDSSGAILLTDDGDFAFQMTHPKFYKVKYYNVRLNKDLEPLHQQMISDYGVTLPDGPSKLGLERLSDDSRKGWTVVMSEGRNRQIRRTFMSLGYTVVKLHRTSFGNYSVGDIKSGEWQKIDIS